MSGRFALRPVVPCEMQPAGIAGVLCINGHPYLVSAYADLPEEGEPVLLGWQLTKAGGTTYEADCRASWGGWACSCPDGIFNGERPHGCRHIAALRQALADDAIPRMVCGGRGTLTPPDDGLRPAA